MNNIIVINAPFRTLKDKLMIYYPNNPHYTSFSAGIDRLQQAGFDWSWALPQSPPDYRAQLENVARDGIINSQDISEAEQDLQMYTRAFNESLDGIVVVHRAQNFNFNIGIEAVLFNHALQMVKPEVLYFLPQFAPRSSHEGAFSFDGHSDVSIADLDELYRYLEGRLGSEEAVKRAQFQFIGEDVLSVALLASYEYAQYIKGRNPIIRAGYSKAKSLEDAQRRLVTKFGSLDVQGLTAADFRLEWSNPKTPIN
jgi:hypothetical protein